jgi:hypothetical protein
MPDPTIVLDMPLRESDVVIGDELITNGDFSVWSGAADPNNTPTGWSKSAVGAGYYVADAGNACRLVSDGNSIYIYQTPLTAGRAYKYMLEVSSIVAGGIKTVHLDGELIGYYVTPGIKENVFRATSTWFVIQRYSGVTDVTFSDVSLKEYYIRDYSSNAYHGSPANQPTWETLDSGITAPVFNGTTDLIDSDADMVGTGDISCVIFAKPSGLGESNQGAIFNNGKFIVRMDGTDGNRIAVSSDGGSTWAYSAASSVTLNLWHCIGVTVAADGTANIYINGPLSGSADQDSGIRASGTTNVFIGNNSAGDRAFIGQLSNADIYSGIADDPAAWFSAIYAASRGYYLPIISGATGATLDASAILSRQFNLSGETGAELYARGFISKDTETNRKGIMKGY